MPAPFGEISQIVQCQAPPSKSNVAVMRLDTRWWLRCSLEAFGFSEFRDIKLADLSVATGRNLTRPITLPNLEIFNVRLTPGCNSVIYLIDDLDRNFYGWSGLALGDRHNLC